MASINNNPGINTAFDTSINLNNNSAGKLSISNSTPEPRVLGKSAESYKFSSISERSISIGDLSSKGKAAEASAGGTKSGGVLKRGLAIKNRNSSVSTKQEEIGTSKDLSENIKSSLKEVGNNLKDKLEAFGEKVKSKVVRSGSYDVNPDINSKSEKIKEGFRNAGNKLEAFGEKVKSKIVRSGSYDVNPDINSKSEKIKEGFRNAGNKLEAFGKIVKNKISKSSTKSSNFSAGDTKEKEWSNLISDEQWGKTLSEMPGGQIKDTNKKTEQMTSKDKEWRDLVSSDEFKQALNRVGKGNGVKGAQQKKSQVDS